MSHEIWHFNIKMPDLLIKILKLAALSIVSGTLTQCTTSTLTLPVYG